ncbi:hypothetical protein BH10CYA1_BH10CYA1_20430 [soil metagenome]
MGDRSIATDGGNSEISPTPSVPWYESQTPNHIPLPAPDRTSPGLTDLPNLTFNNGPTDYPGSQYNPGRNDIPGLTDLPELSNIPSIPPLNPERPAPAKAPEAPKLSGPDHLGFNAGGDLAALGFSAAEIGRHFVNPKALSLGLKGGGIGLAFAGIAIGDLTKGNMTTGDQALITGFGMNALGAGILEVSSAFPKLRPVGLVVETLGKVGLFGGALKRIDELGEHYHRSLGSENFDL